MPTPTLESCCSGLVAFASPSAVIAAAAAGAARRRCRFDITAQCANAVPGGQRRAQRGPLRSRLLPGPPRCEGLTATAGARTSTPPAAVSVAAFTGTIDDVTMVNDAGKPIPGALTRAQEGMASDRTTRLRAHVHHDRHRPRARRHAVPPDVELHHSVAGLPGRRLSRHHRRRPDPGRRHVRRRHGRRRALRLDDHRQEPPPRSTARHHQPARRRIVELGRRPDRSLATREVLRARHFGRRVRRDVRHAAGRRPLRRSRTNMFRSRSETRTSRSPTTRQSKSACSTTASWSGPCRRRWAWVAPRPSVARPCQFWTPPGVYTVMDKANPVVMDSSTFGLPIGSAPWLPRDRSRGPRASASTASISTSSTPPCGLRETPTPPTAV